MKIGYILGKYSNSNDGIGRYARNVIENIKISKLNVDVVEIPPKHKVLFSTYKPLGLGKLLPSSVTCLYTALVLEVNYFKRFIYNVLILPREVAATSADVCHAISPSEAFAAVKTHKRPFVCTIHDIIPLVQPSRFFLERLYFRFYMRFALKAERIITVSTNTKNDILHYYDVDESKILVVYPGIEGKFKPNKNKHDNLDFTILYVGGLTKRKGVYETIEAFSLLTKKHPQIKLRIVGGGEEYEYVKAVIEKNDLSEKVRITGFVNENTLIAEYQNADLLVYPSKYEGFGFIPLEAMSCGLPVITSNTTSLPEVVGNAAILVDPFNIRDITRAIEKIVLSSDIRKQMIAEGLQRANTFTWKNSSVRLVQSYTEPFKSVR